MIGGFEMPRDYYINNPYGDEVKTISAKGVIEKGFRDTYVVMKTKKRSKSKERMKKQSRRSNRR